MVENLDILKEEIKNGNVWIHEKNGSRYPSRRLAGLDEAVYYLKGKIRNGPLTNYVFGRVKEIVTCDGAVYVITGDKETWVSKEPYEGFEICGLSYQEIGEILSR